MKKLALLSILCLVLAGCQVAPQRPEIPSQTESLPQPGTQPLPQRPKSTELPRQTEALGKYIGEVGRMSPEQLLVARESAMRQHANEPSDATRLRAGYALSRAPATAQQLARSRELLAGISPDSELAPMRDLLDGEILKFIEVQEAEAQTRELRAEFDDLQVRFAMLQEQLDALKKIETEIVESQEETEEME